jgi:hypothetical protein
MTEADMTQGPTQAMNLGGRPEAYNDSFIALDRTKGLSEWQYWNGREGIPLTPDQLPTDERGWVTDLPVIDGQTTAIFANFFYGTVAKPQQFIMEWDGTGTIEVGADYTVIGKNKILIDFRPDYTDDASNPQQDGLGFLLSSTDPNNTGDYIRNIRLYNVDDADLIEAGERFDPDWFDRVDDFRVLRTHDWQYTNFPTTVDWTRNVESADQAVWGVPGRSMPYELLVQMANETRSDLWVNIPHTASKQYMREAAEYLKQNLAPGLRLQVEFSNEYWTTIFDQYDYFVQGGARRFGDDPFAAGQFYGVKAAQMAKIFEDVFGKDSKVLLPTLTVDDVMFATGEAEAMLTAPSHVAEGGKRPVTQGFDVIATDGYLSWWAPDTNMGNLIRDWMTDADGGFGRARDFLIDQLNTSLLPNWQKGRVLADKYGLDFMVYEGGALLLNNVPDEDEALTDFAVRFTKSDELREVYDAMVAAWASVGTGAFAWYADVGRPGKWGDYGHWKGEEFVPDPRTGAITDANDQMTPWWDGDDRPSSTWDNGRYDAGTARDNTMKGTDLADRLYGLRGDDSLIGRAGDDRLWGGKGSDVIRGGKGADDMNGGTGRDLADYSTSSTGVNVSLYRGKGTEGHAKGDRLVGIEMLQGSDHADRLSGDAGANALSGGRGNDTLRGGWGEDTLTGGGGDDRFVFHNLKSAGDALRDFDQRGDDVIALSGAGFGDHARGGLAQAEFQASNKATAQTADVRIIVDRDDNRILFDADGRGGRDAVLLATVPDADLVTRGDFVFF